MAIVVKENVAIIDLEATKGLPEGHCYRIGIGSSDLFQTSF